MNSSLQKNIAERDSLIVDEAARLLWKWRRYRNEAFWHSVYRFGAASVALTLIPYLLPDLIGKLGLAVFVFPVMAFLLSVFAAYLTAVQYKLYKQVDREFKALLGKYCPEDIADDKPINRIFRISIGRIVAVVFLCLAVIVEFLNGLVLFYLVRGSLP